MYRVSLLQIHEICICILFTIHQKCVEYLWLVNTCLCKFSNIQLLRELVISTWDVLLILCPLKIQKAQKSIVVVQIFFFNQVGGIVYVGVSLSVHWSIFFRTNQRSVEKSNKFFENCLWSWHQAYYDSSTEIVINIMRFFFPLFENSPIVISTCRDFVLVNYIAKQWS